MKDALTLTEIADALDTLADVMASDRTDELAGYNASFWRDAALVLRQLEDAPGQEPTGRQATPAHQRGAKFAIARTPSSCIVA